MKNPSGARRSGGVQISDRIALRSEGSSANRARVGARQKAGGDAQSIFRSSVHSLLNFRFAARCLGAKGRGFYARRFAKSSTSERFSLERATRGGEAG